MNGERGLVLVWGMLIVVLIGAASSVFFVRSNTLLAESTTDRMRHQSFWAAEGGLEHARHALAMDPEFAGGTTQVGECRAISRVTKTDDGWKVEVRATPGGARISATLKPGEGLPTVEGWRSE
jgi:type II secretory pathway component PulK